MKTIVAIACAVFATACNNNSPESEKKPVDSLQKPIPIPIPVPITSNDDTLFVNKASVVYYQPDSLQMETWKKEVGAKDFETVVDDWSYYMMTSRELLSNKGIPVEDAAGRKAVKFTKADGSTVVFSLDTLKNYWNAWLFTPAKSPQYIEIINIEDSYKAYFNK